jgi:molybdopterin-binding protein
MQISARNSLKGKIKSIEAGAVNSQVIIELSNGAEVAPDYHKRFSGKIKLDRRQRSLRHRQGARRDDWD